MTESPAAASPFFPVSLNVAHRRCLVVGAGFVAARKAGSLLACAATVTVVAPDVSDDMDALVPRLAALERRRYRAGEVEGYQLVVSATGDPAVDGAVYADCEAAGIWVNSADDPAHCSFILPAVHREGPVSIAVSTGGASPALASWLRSRIGADFGPGLAELAELLDAERGRLRQAGLPSDAIDWPALFDGGLLALVRAGDLEQARAEVARAPRR